MKRSGSRIVLLIVILSIITLGETTECLAKKPKIGICFGSTGPGDRSFNSMLYNGSIEVQNTYDVTFVYKIAEKDEEQDYKERIRLLIEQEHCDFVITATSTMKSALDAMAKLYPEIKFVLLDVPAEPADNVASVVFAQHEGSFVVGALAASVTETRKIGFIGGMDIQIIHAFLQGFKEGIAYIDPSIELLVEYCSFFPDFSGFKSPEKGLELANKMYAEGVDIIYAVAAGSGNGVIHAAKIHKKYAIGVDSNQDYMAPGFVLTSMMKKLDVAVFDICEKFLNGEFQGNVVYEYGYKNGGVGITPMEFTRDKIPEEVLTEIKEIEKKIAHGEIVVTNLMTQQE